MSAHPAAELQIYDTTLRDGAQQEGLTLSVADKLTIAQLLDDFGVHFIEGGWPGAVPVDTEFFRRATTELRLRNAQLAAFGSTKRAGGDAGRDPQVIALLEAQTPVVTLVAKSHDRHVRLALRTSTAENLNMVRDTVRQLVAQGRRVFVDAEHYFDGYRANRHYAIAVIETAFAAGAEKVVLCDTNGGTLPTELAETVAETAARGLSVGIHCHDDAGCAVANTLLAVQAGASHVQGTANGYGERCGNANLFSIVANLVLKEGYRLVAPEQLAGMTGIAEAVGQLTALPVGRTAPYVGTSAFTHKGGLHASAVRIDPGLYQHIDPGRVGNHSHVLVSDLGGRSSVQLKALELGYRVEAADERVERVITRIKELGRLGYTYEAADASFELLLREHLAEGRPWRGYDLLSWQISSEGVWPGSSGISRATVRAARAGTQVSTVGVADHPFRALCRALCAALLPAFPAIADLALISHESRVVLTQVDPEPVHRVLLRFRHGGRHWATVGVHRDPAAAALTALRDAADYVLARSADAAASTPARPAEELAVT